ncbi:glyoxalase [Bradyrhizobium sp. KBS0727]|uniref:VOC family protein n=1 Tax=unclassified Bradyrhizobium TaxID=2631580 RepID=UPI00110EE70D|nr:MULTISPECIES: VOC family protein [unclassified Bradyrhizobium]QDW40548.1 glyoxalase [Bradyrhizobium sp. KBS0725]QDW47153.1 glyoxalase [Bradyrhizobium sp. KBS0727]
MIKVSRIGHLTLETPDLDRQLDYYQRVMGLHLADRYSSSAYLCTGTGELAVVLEQGATRRCKQLAFQVPPQTDLAAAARALSSNGIKAQTREESRPGGGKVLVFTDPNGTEIELFTAATFAKLAGPIGIAPFKLGHVAFIVDDPVVTAAFYERILGFRVSDWVERFFVFMRCGPDHHTVNFLRADGRRMHHFAFEMRDAAHLTASCDVLGREKLEIIWGPVRHGPGHNIATYHLNTDDLMIELYTELDKMSCEDLGHFDPKPWHEDHPQRPKTWEGPGRRDVWGPAIPSNFLLQGY